MGAFSCAHAVTIDDNIGRVVIRVFSHENVNGILDAAFDGVCHDFLALFLHDEVGVVLAELLVDRGGEADNRIAASVANIDTDQHRLHVAHLVGQFEVVEVAAHLAIELLQDVGGLGEVEVTAA